MIFSKTHTMKRSKTDAGIIEGPNAWDGYLASVTADALIRAQKTGEIVKVESVTQPEFYK